MKGYWRSEANTQEVVRGGWLYTGDLGYWDEEGYIYLAGRAKDTIKRGGEMISPEEVEGVLRTHPAVDDAAVIGVPDVEWGEQVRAVVTLRPNAPGPVSRSWWSTAGAAWRASRSRSRLCSSTSCRATRWGRC